MNASSPSLLFTFMDEVVALAVSIFLSVPIGLAVSFLLGDIPFEAVWKGPILGAFVIFGFLAFLLRFYDT